MKGDFTFKRAFNDSLDLMRSLPPGRAIPSETRLAGMLLVSRTTVRKILAALDERGITEARARIRFRSDAPVDGERFPEAETISVSQMVEAQFLEWMLRGDARPGTAINELDLARQFGVATPVVREFLNRFQRFGLIEKRVGPGWEFKGFTSSFAEELFEIREMFELRSARAFAALDPVSPLWVRLREARARHLELLAQIGTRYREFSILDSAFHRLVNAARPNRFVDSFFDVITMVFHYHYQWNKQSERERNEAAVHEHLAYIDALLSRDPRRTERACAVHLASARETLMRSIAR